MLFLVDCNNFYVSCERSFNPLLNGKAVGVLSNNDGCVVARSNELKALGVKMGTPAFQFKPLIGTNDVRLPSSNYTLYGDLSARIMATLGRFADQVEVYSIDEAFMDMNGYELVYGDLVEVAHQIRQTIDAWTRIPVSIGIAPTKTLCKVANYYAKREASYGGVAQLDTPDRIQEALSEFPVAELSGVGWRYAGMLHRNGIRTAAQFAALPDDWINQFMTVNGLRLAYALRGTPCKMLETEAPARKALCSAPSFGRGVADLATISQALTTHLSRIAEKLRRQQGAASALTVFLHTNRFKRSPNGEPAKSYYNSRSITLPHPTAATPELTGYALAALQAIYRFGYDYQKVGVMLSGFVPQARQ